MANELEVVKFNITEKNIHDGMRNNCWMCPATLAMSRKLDVEVAAGYFTIQFFGGKKSDGEIIYIKTPSQLSDWMKNFDLGARAEPMEFELKIPSSLLDRK